eukprot:889191-Pelagomonas_calceolata.AAC.1
MDSVANIVVLDHLRASHSPTPAPPCAHTSGETMEGLSLKVRVSSSLTVSNGWTTCAFQLLVVA